MDGWQEFFLFSGGSTNPLEYEYSGGAAMSGDLQMVRAELEEWGVHVGFPEEREAFAALLDEALGQLAQEGLYAVATALQQQGVRNVPAVLVKRLTSVERIQDEVRVAKRLQEREAEAERQAAAQGPERKPERPEPGAGERTNPGTAAYEAKQNVEHDEAGIRERNLRLREDRLAAKCWHCEKGYDLTDSMESIARRFSEDEQARARALGQNVGEMGFFTTVQIEQMLEAGLARMCPFVNGKPKLYGGMPAVSLARWKARRKAVQGKARKRMRFGPRAEVDMGPTRTQQERFRRIQIKALSEGISLEKAGEALAVRDGWDHREVLAACGGGS